jgi:hypothetical protein
MFAALALLDQYLASEATRTGGAESALKGPPRPIAEMQSTSKIA